MSCAVKGCTNCRRFPVQDVSFHVFPRHESLQNKWLKVLGIDKEHWVWTKNKIICSEHFTAADFVACVGRRTLRPNSVPSIKLFHDVSLPSVWSEQDLRNKDITGNSNTELSKIMSTDADPLEIGVPGSISLFGDSVDNIEFVIESGDESEECELGTKDNPIVIHLTNSDEQGKQLVMNEHISKVPVIDDIHSDVIDLDLEFSDVEEVKDEIQIEEEQIQMISDEETSCVPKKQNTRCYVPNCTVDEKEEHKLLWFKPPRDKNLRKLWDICIDHPDKRMTSDDVVCHQHFSKSDIICSTDDNGVLSKNLKDGAVPCIKFHKECCVPNCNNKSGYMYNFPVLRNSNYELWLYMIKNTDLKKLKMKEVLRHRICARHFEPDCFEDDFMLKSTAAPTLDLPEHNVNQFCSKVVYQQQSSVPNKNINRMCCAYGNCTNNNITGKKLFKFPQDPNRCIAWLTACNREGLISTPEETVKTMASGMLGICEEHFEQDCFEPTGTLKSDAVPRTRAAFTADLFRKSKAFSESSDDTTGIFFINEEGKKIMPSAFTGICSYRNCASKVSACNPFFSFPIDPIRSDQWLRACGLMMSPSSNYQILKGLRICSKHFETHMFESKYKLKKDAVPKSFTKGDELANKEASKMMEKRSLQWDPSKIIYCAVSTCPNNYGLTPGKGRFPNPSEDRERFDIWLKLVDNTALKDVSPQEIYEKYMVCMKHFEPHFYMRDGKVVNLSKEAVPTKFLTADTQWFETSEYYKTRLQKYMDRVDTRFQKAGCIVHNQEKQKLHRGDVNTTCVLEENGIRFLNTGHYIHAERKPNSKRKLPYEVYKFFSSGYGLTNDITLGENIKIHTAIIIDDDDECERRVLQQLLDKRRRY